MSLYLTPLGERRRTALTGRTTRGGTRKIRKETPREMAISLKKEKTTEETILDEMETQVLPKMSTLNLTDDQRRSLRKSVENLPFLQFLNPATLAVSALIHRDLSQTDWNFWTNIVPITNTPVQLLLDPFTEEESLTNYFRQTDLIFLTDPQFEEFFRSSDFEDEEERDKLHDIFLYLRKLDRLMTFYIPLAFTVPEPGTEHNLVVLAQHKGSVLRYLRLIAERDRLREEEAKQARVPGYNEETETEGQAIDIDLS